MKYLVRKQFLYFNLPLQMELHSDLQGGPTKVRPTYIFNGDIWMNS